MTKLTIIVDSPSGFSTVVRNNGEKINARKYADGSNCSYSRETADMERPYVSDALQSIIERYRVQETEVQVWNRNEAANDFETMFCQNLTTYTRYPKNVLTDLWTERLKEQREKLFAMSDRELCEAVNAHFSSHPVQVGQKDLKLQAAKALETEGEISLPVYQRDVMVQQFSRMQVQETRIKSDSRDYDPQLLDKDMIDHKNDATVYKLDVALQKNGDGTVSVMGKYADGSEANMGRLKDNFLHNNPMNVGRCDAEVELTDFSNGKMKNLKLRVIVNSDVMSGDIIDLDDDMLAGIGQDGQMEKS